MRIDAHQHFWYYDQEKYSWIKEDMKILQRHFLPKDILTEMNSLKTDGSIAIQALHDENETSFLLDMASKNDFIKGVVGWVNFNSDTIESNLEFYKENNLFKGVRHILQDEASSGYIRDPQFKKGISKLSAYNFTYDLLIYSKQLQEAKMLVKAFPNQKFVIDHIAKPDFKNETFNVWKKAMNDFRDFENVYCKISGMVTELKDPFTSWTFEPYMDSVLDIFGPKRLMIGSDWPVCLTVKSYAQVMEIPYDYIKKLTIDEQEYIEGKTAMEFYNINTESLT
jgi:L-fuconolactonase